MADKTPSSDLLPDAHFEGGGEAPKADPDPDDEELPETPADVVKMLGFDPKGEDFSES